MKKNIGILLSLVIISLSVCFAGCGEKHCPGEKNEKEVHESHGKHEAHR